MNAPLRTSYALTARQAHIWHNKIVRRLGFPCTVGHVFDQPSLQECGWSGGWFVKVTTPNGGAEVICAASGGRSLFLRYA